MTDHYPHLLVNHASLWTILFGIIFLLLGLLRKQAPFLQAGRVLVIVAAVFTVIAVQTGERAEEPVEDMPGFERTTESGRAGRRLIHEHEEAGEWAQRATLAAALFAIISIALARRDHKRTQAITIAALLLAAWALTALGRTAQLGGQIRRPELREAPAAPAPEAQPGS